jgi:hypothetical protein
MLSTTPDLGLGPNVRVVSANTCSPTPGACSVPPRINLSSSVADGGPPLVLVTVILPMNARGSFGFGGSGASTACDPNDPACIQVTAVLVTTPDPMVAPIPLTATAGSLDVITSTPSTLEATFSVVFQTAEGQEIAIQNADVRVTAPESHVSCS